MSISGDKVGDPAHHFDPDEMGEIMWEMRPRFATSAGELKRRKKKEMLAERDRKEVRYVGGIFVLGDHSGWQQGWAD